MTPAQRLRRPEPSSSGPRPAPHVPFDTSGSTFGHVGRLQGQSHDQRRGSLQRRRRHVAIRCIRPGASAIKLQVATGDKPPSSSTQGRPTGPPPHLNITNRTATAPERPRPFPTNQARPSFLVGGQVVDLDAAGTLVLTFNCPMRAARSARGRRISPSCRAACCRAGEQAQRHTGMANWRRLLRLLS